MAFIVETMAGDRRVQLSAESFARQLDFGNEWTKIGIGWLWSINDTGANILAVRFSVGVSNGINGFTSNDTDFVGCLYGSAVGGYATGCTYIRDATHVTYNIAAGITAIRKQGASVTEGTRQTQSTGYVPYNTATTRLPSKVVINRSGSTYSFDGLTTGVPTTPATDSSPYALRLLVEDEASTGYVPIGGATAATITGGNFYDSVLLSWEPVTAIEISNLSIVRYY